MSAARPAAASTQVERLARAGGRHGELALTRRDGVLELVVDGVFAMDSAHTGSEQALARAALQRVPGGALTVCVAGLGLGFTLAEVLADPRVARVDVVELHPELVHWARAGLVPVASRAIGDPRVTVTCADVLDAVPALPPGSVDALLLDVDNGPDFLVHEGNAEIYRPGFLAAAAATLSGRGVLAVWSASASEPLQQALSTTLGSCVHVPVPVRRGRHDLEHVVYLAGLRSSSRSLPGAVSPTTPAGTRMG